jgi:hypothetical protein
MGLEIMLMLVNAMPACRACVFQPIPPEPTAETLQLEHVARGEFKEFLQDA